MYEITDGRSAEVVLDCVCQELEFFFVFSIFLVNYNVKCSEWIKLLNIVADIIQES